MTALRLAAWEDETVTNRDQRPLSAHDGSFSSRTSVCSSPLLSVVSFTNTFYTPAEAPLRQQTAQAKEPRHPSRGRAAANVQRVNR